MPVANKVVPEEFGNTPHLTESFASSVLGTGWVSAASPTPAEPTFANTILDSLHPARVALAASFERVVLPHGEVLDVPGQPIGHVYFPVEGLISIFAGTTAATRIEVASVGYDGMTAPGILLGDGISHGKTLVQVAGRAWRIPASALLHLAEADAGLRRHLLHQVGVALRHIADTVSYSGRATIVVRLARWLLQATCRLGSRRLEFTHDALAEILGVRRPSVTTGLQTLEGRHLVRSTRRTIVVLDPSGLAELVRR